MLTMIFNILFIDIFVNGWKLKHFRPNNLANLVIGVTIFHLPIVDKISFLNTQSNWIPVSHARNIPENNGASGRKIGELESLIPIIKMKNEIIVARKALLKTGVDGNSNNDNLRECSKLVKNYSLIPKTEKEFKRLFDEYSQGISYKQQYLDKNAFVVYYTKGFDGVGRESIEKEDDLMLKQEAQYGARNEAWIGIDDVRAEIDYLLTSSNDYNGVNDIKDLLSAIDKACRAFENYISLAPTEQVRAAESYK